jgi:hypothetical protein
MSFILSAQRDEDCGTVFDRYRSYVAASRQSFPSGAYALASSDWYFDFQDHRCPHDAWLESITFSEPATGERSEHRVTTIRVRLLGAYHDGFVEFVYPRVFRYSMSSPSSVRGLGNWRYDEFRVSPSGHLIHEIEWAGFSREESSRWIIEASDVEFQWIPK